MTAERRSDTQHNRTQLCKNLNSAQLATLQGLELFGWALKFVRRPLFQDPVPVVFDGDGRSFAILEPDGTLNKRPSFDIRYG